MNEQELIALLRQMNGNQSVPQRFDLSQDVGSITPTQLTPSQQRVQGLANLLQALGQRNVPLFSTFKNPRQAYQLADQLTFLDPFKQGGVGEYLPGFSYELAKERNDPLGQGLSLLDIVPGGGLIAAPLKEGAKEAVKKINKDALNLETILKDSKLSNAEKIKKIENNPAIVEAEKRMSTVLPTEKYPNYGSEEWIAKRQFNFPNKNIVGYVDAADELYKNSKSLAYIEQGLEVPKNVMQKNRGQKTATIVIGPPAAGKSAISNPLAVKYNAAIIDPDEAKKVLPEYYGGVGANAVHAESQAITEDVAEIAMARGDNLLFPTVGGRPEKIRNKIKSLKDNGYKVNLVLTELDPDLALVRMNQRFVKTGRLINSDYAQLNKGKPKETYDILRKENIADGYGKIDTTTGLGIPKQIYEDTADIFKNTNL